jgi:hypothetical protein
MKAAKAGEIQIWLATYYGGGGGDRERDREL